MARPTYKLSYFNARGYAEMCRFTFAYAGVPFEDIRYEHDENWLKAKSTFEWGSVPVLEIDGVQLAQSKAILRYLGKEFGLAGDTSLEAAKCDEHVEALSDLRNAAVFFWTETDEAKKAELTAKLIQDTVPKYFGKWNEILEKNSGFLVGKKFSYADFAIATGIEFFNARVGPAVLEQYPALKAHMLSVFAAPGIREWVAKRPATEH